MNPLVSLHTAKQHLHIVDNTYDVDVLQKLQHASDIVMDRLGLTDIPTEQYDQTKSPILRHPVWYDESQSPPSLEVDSTVEAEVLLTLGELWANRETGVSNLDVNKADALLSKHYDPPFA